MTSYREAQLHMFEETILYSERNIDKTLSVPDYAVSIALLKKLVTEIRAADIVAKQPTKSFTTNKCTLKKQVCVEGAKIAKAILAYAAGQKDILLMEKTASWKNQSDLVKSRDEELPQILGLIYNTANVFVALDPNPLIDFTITNSRLTAFQDLASAYARSTIQPRGAIISRKTSIEIQEQAFQKASILLKRRLDNIAEQLSDGFLAGYKNARLLIGPYTTHTQVSGLITDSVTGTPIPWVRIADITNTYRNTSDQNGYYFLRIPKYKFKYTINYTLERYLPMQYADVTVRKGKITVINVQLEPETSSFA